MIEFRVRKRVPITRWLVMAVLVFCLSIDARAELGALANYRGDWMIDENRQHLVATRWTDEGDSLEMRYAYQVDHCPRWTKETWVMRYDAQTGSYAATIRGRDTETATGQWDEASSTMVWTIGMTQAERPGAVERRRLHQFADGTITWTTAMVRNGRESRGTSKKLDVLVPHLPSK